MTIFLLILAILIITIVFVVVAVCRPEPLDVANLRPLVCSISKYRKKDGNVERGECSIDFSNDSFFIKQGTEQIENKIDSIYYFDIWEHQEETFFKFRMRSSAEYIFKSIHFEADKISQFLKSKNIKVEDNRK